MDSLDNALQRMSKEVLKELKAYLVIGDMRNVKATLKNYGYNSDGDDDEVKVKVLKKLH